MKVFIPLSEVELDGCTASEPLVPYRPGLRLLSQCRPEPTGAEKGVNRYGASAHHQDEHPVRPPCPR